MCCQFLFKDKDLAQFLIQVIHLFLTLSKAVFQTNLEREVPSWFFCLLPFLKNYSPAQSLKMTESKKMALLPSIHLCKLVQWITITLHKVSSKIQWCDKKSEGPNLNSNACSSNLTLICFCKHNRIYSIIINFYTIVHLNILELMWVEHYLHNCIN